MRWVGHVARMWDIRGACRANLRKIDHLKDPNFYERIILKCKLKKSVVMALTV
jgi:hypothetical protein